MRPILPVKLTTYSTPYTALPVARYFVNVIYVQCGNTLDAPRPRRRTLSFHRVKAKTPAHATRGGTRQSVFILVSVTIEHALYNKEDPINHYWAVWNMKACAARAIM